MTVWVVVRMTYYDEEELISVHATSAGADTEAARLMKEENSGTRVRKAYYRVVEKAVCP